jgi:hypothetical protein
MSLSSGSRDSRLQLVRHLERQINPAQVERVDASASLGSWVSSGCLAWDRRLPRQEGFRRGSLVEWFVEEPGNGAGTLALLVARQACLGTGTLVVLDVLDETRRFYPPAAAACGIDLQRLIVIRPQHSRDALWAWDQALRCPAVKAVWGWLDTINDRWFRRFQLAAEQSGCLGLLLRPTLSRGKPSWSELQLAISARGAPPTDVAEGRGVRVEVVRCRGAALPPLPAGSAIGSSWAAGAEHGGNPRSVMHLRLEECQGQLQVIAAPEHETSALPLFSELAPPTVSRGASGA